MKTAFIEQFGGPEVLRYGNLPDPVAAPGEVVIDVVAASVNGADWKVRVGQYKQSKFPFALGRDFSGLISAVGEGVMDLKLGDAVFGVCEAGQEGAYAEKIAVKAAAALMLSTDEYQSPATATGVLLDRKRLAEFALRHRMVSMLGARDSVAAGGMMSYAPPLTEMFALADYVDRIAKGAKPTDLPIQQPTKFELIINLKTAKALGLEVPPTLLARADEVIE